MKTDKYAKLSNSRYKKQLSDTNDCSVIAIALACRVSYKEAHAACQLHGRKLRRGMHTSDILQVARHLGFHIMPVKKLIQKSGSLYTPKTIGQKLKHGYYLSFVRGHVFSVINGVVHDWTNDREHRITSAYRVIRKQVDLDLLDL